MRRRRVAFSSDLRQTALKRAGLAVVAALALLMGVLWFGDNPPKLLSTAPTQPIAPVSEIDMPASPEADVAVQMANETVEPPTPLATETETEHPPDAISSQEAGATPNTLPEPPKIVDMPAKTPKATKVPSKQASLTNDGYFIQLGVFNDTENVDRMFKNVTELGMPAHIQSRVVVGPFRNKREAEEARNRLKGITEGIVLPPTKKAAKPSGKPKAKPRQRAK